jgi:hypothetical protein
MPKVFYTERDIEDIYQRGVRVLDIDDSVVLTDLARERALNLGLRLARVKASTSASPQAPRPLSQDEIVAKVKAAVLSRLGETVDPALLETVIRRVIAQIK